MTKICVTLYESTENCPNMDVWQYKEIECDNEEIGVQFAYKWAISKFASIVLDSEDYLNFQ